jgi:hypothetical protein
MMMICTMEGSFRLPEIPNKSEKMAAAAATAERRRRYWKLLMILLPFSETVSETKLVGF